MQWFLKLMEELGIECRVGHPAEIRKAETRKQKHDLARPQLRRQTVTFAVEHQ
jgi:hypothetical protein